jgi:MFS family permease
MRRRASQLPPAFQKLWLSDTLTTFGDGFTMIAGPLLMTTLTNSPLLIAGGAAAQQVPWLIFGLFSGAVVDRVDQRRLIMLVDTMRAVLLAILALLVICDVATVPLVYLLLFLSGFGDTFVVTAGSALVPRLVERPELTRANARLTATRLIGGTLVARPIGAWLFSIHEGAPFVVDSISFLAGVVLLIGLPVRSAVVKPTSDAADAVELAGAVEAADAAESGGSGPRTRSLRATVREGLHVLWRDQILRTLAQCIFVMNLTLAATMAILVLYARDRLDLRPAGYGVLLSTLAVGGLVGTVIVDPARRRFGASVLLKIGLLIEAGTQLVLALTHSAVVAGLALAVFGVHGAVWTVLTVSLRQERVGDEVRGRVMAAYMVLSIGGAATGSVLGGVLVEINGLTTPMWFGFIVVLATFFFAYPALEASAIDQVEHQA